MYIYNELSLRILKGASFNSARLGEEIDLNLCCVYAKQTVLAQHCYCGSVFSGGSCVRS